jgi:hypothetical protein
LRPVSFRADRAMTSKAVTARSRTKTAHPMD